MTFASHGSAYCNLLYRTYCSHARRQWDITRNHPFMAFMDFPSVVWRLTPTDILWNSITSISSLQGHNFSVLACWWTSHLDWRLNSSQHCCCTHSSTGAVRVHQAKGLQSCAVDRGCKWKWLKLRDYIWMDFGAYQTLLNYRSIWLYTV